LRLVKVFYLVSNNVTILIGKHVLVQYGGLLLETLMIAFLFLFGAAVGVLAIETSNPGSFTDGAITNI
jgi:hypothetical protein